MMAGVGGDGSTSTREMDAENVGMEAIGTDCADGIAVVVVVVVDDDIYVCSVDDTVTSASTTSVPIDRLRLARNRQLLDTQDIDVFKPRKRTDRVLKK